LIERGEHRRAAEIALSWPTRPNVMPAIRSIANSRLTYVAFLRRDHDLGCQGALY